MKIKCKSFLLTKSNLISGSFAGVCAYSLVYPIDTIKTLLATNKLSVSNGFSNIIFKLRYKYGLRRLYRGLSATCFGIFPYAGLKFFFFNYYRNLLSKNKSNESVLINLISGALAGCSSVSITYPTDLIRRRKQYFGKTVVASGNAFMPGYLDLVSEVFKKEGLKGFYRGLFCTYCKIIPSTAFVFCINGMLNNMSSSR
jgi:hypothetical protein